MGRTVQFDDVDLIRGHGSIGLELLDALPDVDLVVVCCGGGGLLAGVAAALKTSAEAAAASGGGRAVAPRVVGVEPEGANSMWLSVALLTQTSARACS